MHGLGYRYLAVIALFSVLAVAQTLDPARQPSFRSGFRLPTDGYIGDDRIHDVAHDRAGNIYVAGSTRNRQFPVTPNAYQATYGGDGYCNRGDCQPGDGFLLKLDPSGRELLAATFFGATGSDEFYRVVPTPEGDILVQGWGSFHPVSSNAPYTRTYGGFLARFSSDLSRLLYFTSLPGGVVEMEFDAAGRLHVAGWLDGGPPLTPERAGYSYPCSRFFGGCSFVMRMNAALTKVERMATFPHGLRTMRRAVDGGIWIGGYVSETWADLEADPRAHRYPKPAPYSEDLYIARLSAELDALESGRTVLPESRTWKGLDPRLWEMVIDRSGNLLLTGAAARNLTVTSSALQRESAGGVDAFLLVVRPTGDLQYGTWLGSARNEAAGRVRVDEDGIAWVIGNTWPLGPDNDYQAERPCALWIVGIDPRKRRAASLVDSRCVNLPVAGDLGFYGAAAVTGAGELTIATVPGRAPTVDLLETQWGAGTYGPGGFRVYRMTTRAPAALDLIQRAGSPIRLAETWVLETEIRNHGGGTAEDVALTLALPDRWFSFVSAEVSQGWCDFAVQLRCEVGAVGSGVTVSVRLEVKATEPSWRGSLGGFPAQVQWRGPQQEILYNWAAQPPPRVFAQHVDLALSMDGYKPVVRQGEAVHYSFTIENRGTDNADNIAFMAWWKAGETTNPFGCAIPGCAFLELKAGERRRVDLTVTYPNLGTTSIGGSVWQPSYPYYLDPDRSNNYFSLPIEVVTDSPEPTVLESYRYVTPPSYSSDPPWIEVQGKNIYGTSIGYWDGEARPTYASGETPYTSGTTVSITLQEGDSRAGTHHVKICSVAAGCSNVLEVKLGAPATPAARIRLSMRLENGITSTPYTRPRISKRPVDDPDEPDDRGRIRPR